MTGAGAAVPAADDVVATDWSCPGRPRTRKQPCRTRMAGVGWLMLRCAMGLASAGVQAATCADSLPGSLDRACLQETVEKSDAELRARFDNVLVKADRDRRELLFASQQAWHRYRDAQCAVERDLTRAMHQPYGMAGSMAPDLELRCRLRLNGERLGTLRGTDQ